MAYIYAFAPDAEDCSTIGLVGALLDEDAQFELNAGEFGELTFSHPIDPYGKWQALVNGAILKTMVPMRLCPGVKEDGTYIASVDVYTVSASATKNQRYIYSKKEKGKKKKLLKVGTEVTVTGVADASSPTSRYKVKLGKTSGWMERAGLTRIQQNVPVAQDEGGLESVEPSYAVREQLFRVYEVSPQSDDNNPGSIDVSAHRIAYDLLGNLTTYTNDGLVTCLEACEGILENTLMPHDFSIYTDIGETHAGFDAEDKNPIEALVGPDEGVTARWNAEIVADDYDIYVLHRAGLDRGVSIEYAKNLIGVDVTEDVSDVANAIRPRGQTKSGSSLYLDGQIKNGVHVYNGNTPLPTGYQFYIDPDDNVNGTIIVRSTFDAETALPKIYLSEVSDAKVEKGNAGVTTAIARQKMVENAVGLFESGCDVAEISMSVDFVMLGDTEEYSQYKHLEPLFVYDTVHIRDRRVNVASDINLTSITWDVRHERVEEADFGSLKNLTASISGWQISSVSGGKIVPGTVDAGALGNDSVSVNHVQTNSINAQAMQTETFTADTAFVNQMNANSLTAVEAAINNISASNIHTNTLAAAFASLFSVVAGKISAREIEVGKLDAIVESVVTLTAGSADFDVETVRHLVSSVLQATVLTSGLARIENLYVTQANLMNATLDRLTLLAADGETYYDIGVGTDGSLTATVRDPATVNPATGTTTDGRNVLDASGMEDDPAVGYDVPSLDGLTIQAGEDGLLWVYQQALSVGKLRATEAFIGSAEIPSLQTAAIEAVGNSMTFSANQVIQMLVGVADGVRAWFTFGQDGLVTRKTGSKWSTRVAEDGYYIDHDDVIGHVGAFYKESANFRSLQVTKKAGQTNTDIRVRPTSTGGWVWTD